MQVSATMLVNDPNLPGQVRLNRDQVWDGLLRKAENATPFVPAITECTVLERFADGLVREIVVRGQRLRETVTFEPKRRVSFARDDEADGWVITNDIGEDASGELTVTFGAEIASGPDDSEPDQDVIERMKADYLDAIASTMAFVRQLVAPTGADSRA